jgi:ABC-2 type transport system ATP-binding protein/lipopolysaccharide transport system ATP-binding protein
MASIELDRVTLEYPIYSGRRSFTRQVWRSVVGGEVLVKSAGRGVPTVRALDEVSLALGPGDRVGLIGPNGAGKSTLLRMIAGIYTPQAGAVRVVGRVFPFLTSLPGVNSEDTGRDNLITAVMLLGLSRRDFDARYADIRAASGLGDYLDLPVRTYSAGMQVRLGFALASAIAPEILLLDEGLVTGDAEFARGARLRLQRLLPADAILVIAAHDSGLLRSLCSKGLWLARGRIAAFGPIDEVLARREEAIARED